MIAAFFEKNATLTPFTSRTIKKIALQYSLRCCTVNVHRSERMEGAKTQSSQKTGVCVCYLAKTRYLAGHITKLVWASFGWGGHRMRTISLIYQPGNIYLTNQPRRQRQRNRSRSAHTLLYDGHDHTSMDWTVHVISAVLGCY